MRTLSFLLFWIFFLFPEGIIAQQYAPFGGPFTPRGDIRFLIIFAGFENECDGSKSGIWPDITPEQGNEPCKGFPIFHDDLFYSDFSQFSPDASDKTISNFFYQASRHHPENPPLRIVADIFPERINVKGSHQDNYSVFKIIQEKYPNFDWSRYDQRTNNPNFRFDNSNTGPDGLIDYIVVVWRRRGAGGYANTIGFKFTTKIKGKEEVYATHPSCGFTLIRGMADNTLQVRSSFLHEIAHTLFNCPHLFGANGVTGNYLYASQGWGMMSYGAVLCSANSWESWYNGWIELSENRNLKSFTQNGIYTLKDFVTTGDAMRIKLPFVNQYLWIENHAGLHSLDERDEYTTDGFGKVIPPSQKGLFLFVEGISDDRTKIISALGSGYSNGLKAMHGSGNFDYTSYDYKIDPGWWNNMVVNFSIDRANPTSAHNDICLIRGNFGFDTSYPDKIIYRNYTNNPSESCRLCSENCPPNLKQEYVSVIKKDSVYVYEGNGISMAFGDGILPQKIGMSNNPMIINHQKYICPDKLEPICLNGISITILERGEKGEITFEVKFDDTQIISHQRMTGGLILNDIENAEFDIHITRKKSLTIDKSGTPNRVDRGALVNGAYEFPDFVNPSCLSVANGAKILIDKKAKLLIKDNSSLIIRSGATLIVRGKLKVGKAAHFIAESGAIVRKEGRGKINYSR